MKKRAKVADRPVAEIEPKHAAWARFQAFLEQRAIWLAIGLVALATLRVVSTYFVFSHTFDEPAHIACGMEWLEKHAYTYEPQHPPLARVMTAILPKLLGAHGDAKKSMWDEGLAILFRSGAEDSTLAWARLGILPFFWITCWITFSCTRWITGQGSTAVLAVFLVTMTPSVLAHAGLATTDMGLTAMFLLATYSLWRWAEEPVLWRAAAFGASTGLAVLAKFSTLAFFPSVAVVGLLMWICLARPPVGRLASAVIQRLPQALLAALIAAVVIWAGYQFSFGKTTGFSFPVPAPELFNGIDEVRKHNATGHMTYMLSEVNNTGWPQFYLVALAVKTPLPVLALGVLGLLLLCTRVRFGSRGWIIPSVVFGILICSSFFSQIRIGSRHVLPVFVALGIAGACAVQKWKPWMQAAIGIALVLTAASSLAAHPNYLAYFNLITSDKPEAFLVDSDLDWGQDNKRLARRLKELGATEIYFNKYLPGDFEKLYGFPPIHALDPAGPHPGWNVVSLTPLKWRLFGDTRYALDPGVQLWPEASQPTERVGNSFWLFFSNATAPKPEH